MNKLLLMFLAVLIVSCQSKSETYNIMSYNIRYDNPNDGENQWSKRKVYLSEQILSNNPDFLGIQEGLHHQVQFLDSALVDYNFIGVGRDDGKTKGEYSAIFYNNNKFNVLKQGTFWLSETPDKISVGWDAAMGRICSYGLFKDKANKQQFWVFNTHFDHIGNLARYQSSKLILQTITDLNQNHYPVIITGDFNLLPESKPIQYLSNKFNDSKLVSSIKPLGPEGTFNGFKTDVTLDKRIDYIFTSQGNTIVNRYQVLEDKFKGRYLSDHLPVLIELKIIKP